MKYTFWIITTLLLSGCITTLTPVTVRDIPDDRLCIESRAKVNQGVVFDEILRRGLMSSKNVAVAKRGEIVIGMSECGLLAAMGPPMDGLMYCGDIISSTNSFGVNKQYVYTECFGNIKNTKYVNLQDGFISGWVD